MPGLLCTPAAAVRRVCTAMTGRVQSAHMAGMKRLQVNVAARIDAGGAGAKQSHVVTLTPGGSSSDDYGGYRISSLSKRGVPQLTCRSRGCAQFLPCRWLALTVPGARSRNAMADRMTGEASRSALRAKLSLTFSAYISPVTRSGWLNEYPPASCTCQPASQPRQGAERRWNHAIIARPGEPHQC